MQPTILDCRALEWLQLFKKHAAKGEEVDLINFNHGFYNELCERIAGQHNLRFTVDHGRNAGFLRSPTPNTSQA